MVMMPEEAGKLPWTEGSLELLKNIKHEMERWTTTIDESYPRCNKSDCYFCRLTNPIPRPIVPEFIMSGMDKFKLSANLTLWSDQELKLLDRYKDAFLPTLVDIFPGRTKSAISDKRSRYRKSLGLPHLYRGGIKTT